MTMVDQQTQQQISDLVNACGGYWELRGIPHRRRMEMRLELEQHLEQAVHDGKTLQTVVGANALAFAESWARETPHQFPRGFTLILRWMLFDWLAYALLLLLLIALFEHLVLLSPSFPFALVHLVAFAFIGLFTLLQAMSGFFSPRFSSRENRLRLTFGVYAGISLFVVLLLSLAQAPWHRVLFRWDWPFTLLLILGAAVLVGLKVRFARDARQKQQL
ncbi:MAG: hypothetical protein E6I80_28220 [Chloroflexi bacterium]|nr:MAG: hypothetical protein E6I80_28220 [Chloroflexota bacterium]